MMRMMIFFFLFIKTLWSQPVVETHGQLQVDWGNLILSSTFEYALNPQLDYLILEREAGSQGLSTAYELMVEYFKKKHESLTLSMSEPTLLAQEISKTISTRTAFQVQLTKDHIRLVLKAALAPSAAEHLLDKLALSSGSFATSSSHSFSSLTQNSTKYSGVIFDIKGNFSPLASYRLLDESGLVLFEAGFIDPLVYQQKLMGKWYTQPTSNELRRVVKDSPLRVTVLASQNKTDLILPASHPPIDEIYQAIKSTNIMLVLEKR